jgi:molecular chaperone HscB
VPTDPFDLLGLPPTFNLDMGALQREFLRRSAAIHPDRATETGGEEDEQGESADLNRARQILENPELRAEALLARLGGARKEADRSLPPGFLAEMMSTREQIEEARASGDQGAISRWEEWADQRRREHIRAVSGLFAEHGRTGEAAVLGRIRVELNVWRYTERLLEQLDGFGD